MNIRNMMHYKFQVIFYHLTIVKRGKRSKKETVVKLNSNSGIFYYNKVEFYKYIIRMPHDK